MIDNTLSDLRRLEKDARRALAIAWSVMRESDQPGDYGRERWLAVARLAGLRLDDDATSRAVDIDRLAHDWRLGRESSEDIAFWRWMSGESVPAGPGPQPVAPLPGGFAVARAAAWQDRAERLRRRHHDD